MNGRNDLAGRRILVVEDEALLSMLLEDLLVGFGCEVVGIAARFDDAMHKVDTLDFDAALLDVNLNGTYSVPIAEKLARRRVPFVLATGYGSMLPETVPPAPILQKPFDEAALARALQAALRGPRD